MQFKNLGVSKKIWGLLLTVQILTLCAGFSMTAYLNQVEDAERHEVQDYENRIRMAIQWQGVTDLAVGHAVLSAMSLEEHVSSYAADKTQRGITEASEIQKQLEQALNSQEGQHQLALIAQARAKVLETIARMLKLREQMDFGQSQTVMERELLPAVALYNQAQTDLVTLQERMRDKVHEEGAQARQSAMTVGGIALGGVVLLGLWLSVWVVRQITRPLDQAVGLADTIAAGNLTVDVYEDRKDELGVLLRRLNTMTQRLRDVVSEVRHGVDSVSSAASQIATGNQDLSGRTEQTAANLEETAASIEELTATVSQSADTARQANQLASTAVQAAERGGQVVEQVVSSMQQITRSSHKIADIIGVIDGIAFQTNILALNAAVEAARAGEQGRGFAVVAGEVRSLAQRSAEAAKEIKALISDSVSNVDTGSAQVAEAGESMHEIVSSVRRVTDLIGEISAAATEQHDGFSQVNQAVSNLDQMTQQNASLVEESSAAALAMNEQAQRLAQVVAVFNVGQAGTSTFAPSPAPVHRPVAAPPVAARAPVKTAAVKALRADSQAPAAGASEMKAGPSEVPSSKKTTAPHAARSAADDEWESF